MQLSSHGSPHSGLLRIWSRIFSKSTRTSRGRSEAVEVNVKPTGMMSFPQVLVGGELLGGFSEVAAAAESGRLKELASA